MALVLLFLDYESEKMLRNEKSPSILAAFITNVAPKEGAFGIDALLCCGSGCADIFF